MIPGDDSSTAELGRARPVDARGASGPPVTSAPPRSRPVIERTVGIAALVFGLALVVRVAALDREGSFTGDEAMHVANAHAYAEHGHLGPDNWYHPPLKHLLTYAGIRALGDGPYGWRMRNVAFGAGTVVLVFLLARALVGAGAAAVTAALLLAMDPLHVAFSRSTFEDVPAAFFLLLALLLSRRHYLTGGSGSLYAAGAAFGFAVALRSYAVAPLVAVATVLAVSEVRRRLPARVLGIVAALLVVPFLIYLAAWAPWFRRGYGLEEWLALQRWAFVEATAGVGAGFDPILMKLASPWRWFVAPIGVAFEPGGAGARQRIVAIMNDPPLWILVLPAMVALAVRGIRERRWELLAVPATFTLLYVPFLLAPRPIFLYSSLPLLPFGFVAVSHLAVRVLRRWTPVFTVLAALWCAYLYPLATGAPVPRGWYEPVLGWVELVGRR